MLSRGRWDGAQSSPTEYEGDYGKLTTDERGKGFVRILQSPTRGLGKIFVTQLTKTLRSAPLPLQPIYSVGSLI